MASSPPPGGTTAELVLHARVAGHPLELAATIGSGGWEFAGTLAIDAGQGAPDLAELLRALLAQAGLAALPAGMIPSVTVTEMSARFAAETFALAGTFEVGAGRGPLRVGFASLPEGRGCVVALAFDADIPLHVDILRGVVPAISLSGLRAIYASEAVGDLPAAVAAFIATGATNGQKHALARGISLGGRLGTATDGHDLIITQPPSATESTPAKPGDGSDRSSGTSAAPGPDGDGAFRKWFEVDKTFGPLALRRVGGEWSGQEGRLGVLLDAAVDLFGLRVGLAGLKVSLPLKDPRPETLEIGLDGLDLAFKQGPVEISGGLLRIMTGGSVEYRGTALIKTEAFSISGLGAYTTLGADPSLFIYALLDRDLGGPPCFHVTGLAAGFGYNRALKIPEIERVHEFPLIQAAMHPEQSADLGAISTALAAYIPAARGEYWLAAGVRFTSFEMIQSFALVAVSFGTETVITGLGLSRLTVPSLPSAGEATPIEPIAVVEVALRIVLRPASGTLTTEARLTPASYVFSKDCHLTGGFAFYVWFKDVPVPGQAQPIPAGDFVVTLGGYHPKFTAPAHYPVVPRLALNWQVSSRLRVAGEVYFALTPTCLMAGGRLSAVFQDGGLRAWFDAYAHFFIAWKPVQYDVEVGIRIGIGCRISVLGIAVAFSIEMSAAVHLWGPPFAGKAEIDWTIVSFTVYFGEARTKPEPPSLGWREFAQSFLPPAAAGDEADPLTVAVVRGVIREVKPRQAGEPGYVVVNPHQVAVLVKSAVPCTSVDGDVQALTGRAAVGIAPMGIARLEASDLVVEVRHGTQPVAMTATAVEQHVPGALWGGRPFDPRAAHTVELVPDALTGVELSAPQAPESTAYPLADLDQRYDRPEPGRLAWQYHYAPAGQAYEPERVVEHLTASRTDVGGGGEDVRPLRRRLLEALAGAGLIEAIPDDVDDVYRDLVLQAPPVECGVGMLPLYPADRA
jgi:hypothetical protein